ncbi:MAG TPA: penicillin-binding protein 2, partial [Chloroflexi bacterium]|nr:penicillin-binding protein 2 [Chloroflexota bacterium]
MSLRRTVLVVLLGAVLVAGCEGPLNSRETPTSSSSVLPVSPTVEAYFAAWEEEDYGGMYQLLSSEAQSETTKEEFAWYHQSVMEEATVTSFGLEPSEVTPGEGEARVDFVLKLETILLGSQEIQNWLSLVWEDVGWRVAWSPEAILPSLTKDNLVYLHRQIPARANIYDRDGQPLAMDGSMVTVGVVPQNIESENALLAELSRILNMSWDEIKSIYSAPGVQPHWFVPIANLSFEESMTHAEALEAVPGVMLRETAVRIYPQGDLAAHVLGYLGEIGPEELATLASQGYAEGDVIGREGLERWGETYLMGRRGGLLTIVTPSGELVDTIVEYPATQSRSIHTTIDSELQRVAEQALGEHQGAVVALDPSNGEILALATNPRFDPNELTWGRFEAAEWEALASDPARPLVNRATQGLYPTGSVFKVVTAAAAMEGAGYSPQTTINCTGSWAGLGPGWVKYDWLRTGHGPMNFRSALVRSCDVFFWEMGLRLDSLDQNLLPSYAHFFGFGEPTGVDTLDEAEGLVPDPEWKEEYFTGVGNPFWVPGDAVNLAVGQGDLLATPVQVANMMAAIANGGILYKPHLVSRISGTPQEAEQVFTASERGRVPLSAATLQAIREGLDGVTSGEGGTAFRAFEGATFTSAGKTGTAETPQEKPHAWFAGYAPVEAPQIAVAVVVENSGEGSV